jgi:hypothetical protein
LEEVGTLDAGAFSVKTNKALAESEVSDEYNFFNQKI